MCTSVLQGAHLEQHLLEPINIRVSQKLIRGGENETLLMIGRNVTKGKVDLSLLFVFAQHHTRHILQCHGRLEFRENYVMAEFSVRKPWKVNFRK